MLPSYVALRPKGTPSRKKPQLPVEVTITRTEAIDLRRKRLGLTKAELAAEAGLSVVYGRDLMRGDVESGPGLTKIEQALCRLELRKGAA